MSKANVAAVLLAIGVSKQIASRRAPELRYAPKANDPGGSEDGVGLVTSWVQRSLRSIKFVLSLLGVRELAVMASIVSALICRSMLRLKLINLSTEVENSVMRGSERSFWKSVETFAYYVIPTSASYAVFNYLLSELAIGVRGTISTRLLSKFTSGKVYFQVINATQLQSITQEEDKQLESSPNPDQILTNDVEHFSYALSGLFSHVMRPMVDIIINAQRLYTTGGAVVPLVMGLYLVVTSNVLNYIRAPVGTYTDREQSLEGEYRALIARIANSAEEIAALEGGKNEESHVLQSLHPLLEYSRQFAQFRCNMSFIDAVVARYWLMMLGWRIVGLHFFRQRRNNSVDGEDEDSGVNGEFLFRDYQNMSKTMLALSNAVGELIMSGKDVVKVFAYAEKLSTFEEALDELLRREAAHRDANSELSAALAGEAAVAGSKEVPAVSSADDLLTPELVRTGGPSKQLLAFAPLECIALQGVTIAPPSGGAPLHTDLNIVFRRGMHTIITGKNGSGKSSLLRVMAGIWPARAGVVRRPLSTGLENISSRSNSNSNSSGSGSCRIPVLYLPQAPYMALGTLRQQVVYPEILPAGGDFSALDAELTRILHKVHLGHLLKPSLPRSEETLPEDTEDTEDTGDSSIPRVQPAAVTKVYGHQYTLESVVNWGEVLSGGEKQRLSLARLFYHKPLFVLLDESTSAVSAEVEEALVQSCLAETGATLITISHRPQLRKFHLFELHLDKGGRHALTKISAGGDAE